MKVLYGLRYDLFDVPQARTFAANTRSADFTIDKNNIGPRAGLSWSLDERAHDRAARLGRADVRAAAARLLRQRDPEQRRPDQLYGVARTARRPERRRSRTASPPRHPASCCRGRASPPCRPDFRTQSAWLTNVQLERAVRSDVAVAVGYVNSIGRDLPVQMDENLIPTGATLADGRPIYSTAVSAATRVDPTFNHINVFESIGESTYNAFTATVTKRMTHGWQAQATYTLARGVDTAPLTGTFVVGSGDDRVSDPSNLERDRGVTPFNQTHTFSLSTVLAPTVSGTGFGPALLNNNQLGVILQNNSGLPFNIRSNLDLNADGVTNDRPLDLERNAGRLGRVLNLDLRYSRFVPLSAARRLELFFEAKNLFNTAEHLRREPGRDHQRRRRARVAAS